MTDSGAIAATTAAEPAEFHFFLNATKAFSVIKIFSRLCERSYRASQNSRAGANLQLAISETPLLTASYRLLDFFYHEFTLLLFQPKYCRAR